MVGVPIFSEAVTEPTDEALGLRTATPATATAAPAATTSEIHSSLCPPRAASVLSGAAARTSARLLKDCELTTLARA